SEGAFWHIPVPKSPRAARPESPAAKQLARPCAQTVWLSPDFLASRLGALDGAPDSKRAHPARRGRMPCFCAQDARALQNGAPSRPPRRSGAERGSKPNCLSTGTCELFGGPLSASTAGDFLSTGMCSKSGLAGVCFLLV